jgi:two-component system OmpR family sensor kinase
MSLRTRLVATLLLLAAAGLLTLGVVTYATQRSFLNQRVDDQARTALPTVDLKLGDHHGSGGPGGPGDPGPGGPGARPDRALFDLPSGTYGQRRDATGKIVKSVVLGAAVGATSSPPKLPATMRAGQVVTVSAKGDSGLSYHARAFPSDDGGVTIIAIPLSGISGTLNRLLLVEGMVVAGVLLLLAGASWILVRIGLRPLERIGDTAGAIAAGDLSRRVDHPSPKTEIGRLGVALNGMLARLEGAFAEREASEGRLRQFLSDASHELRTPLASIRGYAELFRIGAARSPADTEKAMGRIEDEAARMGVLVEDLLTLARLDEVRDTAMDEVDLGELAGDAAADARAMDPDRHIETFGEAPAGVLGDADQLRQVLANLLRNALVHTPPGTPIEISTRAGPGEVEVEIRDHGNGLPTDHADALFERFWRAEAGRERGRAGAGLGLAIVAGIVEGHGGRVRAYNAPDGGAAFVVTLPAAPTPAGADAEPAPSRAAGGRRPA